MYRRSSGENGPLNIRVGRTERGRLNCANGESAGFTTGSKIGSRDILDLASVITGTMYVAQQDLADCITFCFNKSYELQNLHSVIFRRWIQKSLSLV